MNHEYWLQCAIDLAITHMQNGEGGPFGAVVVRDNVLLSKGWNMVTSVNDPTAHAEVVAVRRACESLGTFQLEDCIIYSSCEPCPMCLGAIYWARPKALYFAATRHDAARGGFDDQYIYDEVAKLPEERLLPTRCISIAEAQLPFHLWLKQQGKIDY